MSRTIHEECGVFGIYNLKGGESVEGDIFTALFALQHRGQESCGIALNDEGVISGYKDIGLVGEVFTPEAFKKLGKGQIGVGHVRYGVQGTISQSNAQPLVVSHRKGRMAVCLNGALTNAPAQRAALEEEGALFHSSTDTEVIAYQITKERVKAASTEEAITAAMEKMVGAYSLVIMTAQKLIAVRDPHGFRPLCMGKKGDSVIFASETCALAAIGATFERDIEPGEVVVVDKAGVHSIATHCGKVQRHLCIFEYIYLARPDSDIDGTNVHVARHRAGAMVAQQAPVEADMVIGVPDSGMDAAMGYADASGIPFGVGLVKNRYVARTFIAPTQTKRERDVNIKLNALPATLAGKRVVLVDDSIVRGTTSARLVRQLRDAGAKEVHVRVGAPPFLNPCYLGTDISSKENLIACKYTVDEICKKIGADSLAFLSIDSVEKIAPEKGAGFCTACFSGSYPVPVPQEPQLVKYDQKLAAAKQ